jgi:hypothetical protein
MAPKEKPPPWPFDLSDGLVERLPDQLENGFNDNQPRPQVPRERLDRLAQAIHRLGPRPLAELFAELAAGAPVLPRLERYAALEPLADFIKALGGDQLPPPTRLVRGRRHA